MGKKGAKVESEIKREMRNDSWSKTITEMLRANLILFLKIIFFFGCDLFLNSYTQLHFCLDNVTCVLFQ